MRIPSLKALKTVTFLLILFFYGFLLTYQVRLPWADDMARHVKNGEMIMHGHFEVLYSNVYSYTMPDQTFVNHHWLSGVLFYLLHETIGWGGMVIFKVLVLMSALALLFKTSLAKANFWLVAFFSVPTLLILMERSDMRPEIFSCLFVSVFLYALTNSERFGNKIFLLAALQLTWVNMHVFFIIGPVLVSGFLFEKIISQLSAKQKVFSNPQIKRLSFLLLSLILASFINPNGITGALYPLNIFNDYGIPVLENQSLFDILKSETNEDLFSKIIFCLSALVTVISFFLIRKKISVFYLLASVATIAAGIMISRLDSLFALIFLPAVTFNLNPLFIRLKNKLKKNVFTNQTQKSAAVLVFILSIACFVFANNSSIFQKAHIPGIGLTAGTGDAPAFFKKNNLKGPIFNDYDIGSFLIYNFYPTEKVFTDNRPEAYSGYFFDNNYQPLFVNEDAWQHASEHYQFNVIYLYMYSRGTGLHEFIYRRAQDPAWALVFADKYCIMFLRNNEANKATIEKIKITKDNVSERIDYMVKSNDFDDQVSAGDIFNLLGRLDLGEEMFFKIVTKWPESGKTWLSMAQIELLYTNNAKSPLLAIMFLKSAIEAGHKTAEVYSLLGDGYQRIGFRTEAEHAYQKALKINSDWRPAKEQLELIRQAKSNGN